MLCRHLLIASFALFSLSNLNLNPVLADFNDINVEFDRMIEPNKAVEIYKNLIDRGYGILTPVDDSAANKEFGDNLSAHIQKKRESVIRAVGWAEEEAAKHIYNPDIGQSDSVTYVNSRVANMHQLNATFDERFDMLVVLNRSFIHVPMEVYERSESVQMDIEWSSHLDPIWEDEMVKNPEIYRFYFASPEGLFRSMPGMRWRNDSIDMYDVRRRPWFVQGASFPKQMLIMIDTSGSMHGQSLKLAKLAVRWMVDTLGQNDYIAVGQFPGPPFKDPKPGEHEKEGEGPILLRGNHTNCFQTFVPANKRNINKIFDMLEELRSKFAANFNEAVEFGLNLFQRFSEEYKNQPHVGAACNKVFIILTDDGVIYDATTKEIFAKYKDENVRFFTYSLGDQVNSDEDELKKICCSQDGAFGHIPAIGAVSNIIQTHFNQSFRPKYIASLMQNPELIVHPARDLLPYDPQVDSSFGSGQMTSLTMPVYNRNSSIPKFLGLMGTDITVRDMKLMHPIKKLSPVGYSFAINGNGYIIFHPELKMQHGWMKDPPNVDLLEVEFNEEKQKEPLRRKIIDYSKNAFESELVRDFIKVTDEVHTYKATRSYACTNINNTDFGLCGVNPIWNKFYLETNITNETNRLSLTQDSNGFYKIDQVQLTKLGKSVRPILTWSLFFGCSDYKTRVVLKQELPSEAEMNKPRPSQTQQQPGVASASKILASVSSSLSGDGVPLIQTEGTMPQIPDMHNKSLEDAAFWLRIESLERQERRTKRQTSDQDSKMLNKIQENDMEEFKRFLAHVAKKDESSCKTNFVQHLLMDTLFLEKYFNESPWENAATSNVKSRALIMASGITAIAPEYANEPWEVHVRNTTNSFIFQRVFDGQPNGLLFWTKFKEGSPRRLQRLVDEAKKNPTRFSHHFPTSNSSQGEKADHESNEEEKRPENSHVTAFKTMTIRQESAFYKAGVLALTFKRSYFDQQLAALPGCGNATSKVCYLVEDAGYIMAVNEPSLQDEVGHFLGSVDPQLMKSLVSKGVFSSLKEYDYQANCPVSNQRSSATRRAFAIGLKMMWRWLSLLTSNLYHTGLAMQSMLLNLLTMPHSVLGQEATATANKKNVNCVKLLYRYYLTDTEFYGGDDDENASRTSTMDKETLQIKLENSPDKITTGTIEYPSSANDEATDSPNLEQQQKRIWAVNRLLGTNLLLIRVDPKLVNKQDKDLEFLPRDPIQDKGPDVCEMSKVYPYRSNPYKSICNEPSNHLFPMDKPNCSF